MNVLLIGHGGREHAIAWKLRQSSRLTDLHIAPGNGGTAAVGHNVDLPTPKTAAPQSEVEAYLDAATRLASELKVDFVFVAPDDPLAWGLVDRVQAAGIAAFGPSRAAAEIESSKAWAKGFMARQGIAHGRSATFDDAEAAKAYVRQGGSAVVVKADGLSAGKGAIVTESSEQAIAAIDDFMLRSTLGSAGHRVVIEDRLSGREASAQAFTDGLTVRSMPLSCDHKPVFDGNTGPNTGGMGAFSPAPWIDAALEDNIRTRITEPAVAGMAREGRPYRGVIYPGIMVTEAGPQVLEFNARMGDPETQALLPRLKSDLLEIAWACANGRLRDVPVDWSDDASVCVVLASRGYPGSYQTGLPITGLAGVEPGVEVFHAGTRRTGEGILTAGGRVLCVVATGPTLAEARAIAYRNVERIHFEGVHYRGDIGVV